MRVKTDGLNLRTTPVVVPETKITSLPLGHPVKVLGDASREGWKEIEVSLNDETLQGVVAERFLRDQESEAKEALLTETVHQWIRFQRGEGREDQQPFSQFVGEMWQVLGMDLDGQDRDVPWSAAFISFVVNKAEYQGFRASASHARYIHDSIVRRFQGDATSPFWGFRLPEHPPRLGDLVCLWREERLTFDQAAREIGFRSHCDVIVEVRDSFVRAIGGNVRNSVRMKTYSRDENGFLRDTNNVFAILRNNF